MGTSGGTPSGGVSPSILPLDDGSIIFADGGYESENNANLYWDKTNLLAVVGTRGSYAPATGVLHAVETTSNALRGLVSFQASADTGGARFIGRKSRGTPSAPAVVVTGDTLYNVVAEGYDGANFLQMGAIQIVAEGTIAATRVPTRLVFSTATDAAPSVLTEAMRIDSAQRVHVGTSGSLLTGTLNLYGATAAQVYVKNNTGPVTGFLEATTGEVRIGSGTSPAAFYTNGSEKGRFASDGSFIVGSNISTTSLATGGLTVYGAASQKTAVFRANATTPGSIAELQNSAGTGVVVVGTGNPHVTVQSLADANVLLALKTFSATQTAAWIAFRDSAGTSVLRVLPTSGDATASTIDVLGATGLIIGTTAAQKVGFWARAPIVQPGSAGSGLTAWTQTYATVVNTTANPLAAAVATTAAGLASYGYTQAQADSIPVAINNLVLDVASIKGNVNRIIDALQLVGFEA